MTQNKNKIELKNGLFFGASIIGITLLLNGLNKFENSNMLISIACLLLIFSFISIFQGKKYLGNKSFRDSFSAGFKTTVIGALVLGIWTFIFFTFIGDTILVDWIKKEELSILEATAKENAVNITYTETQIKEGIENMKNHLTPGSLGLKLGFFTIILGAITSLVTTTISELIWMKNAK